MKMNNDFFILLDVLSSFLLKTTNKNYSTEKIRVGLIDCIRILLYFYVGLLSLLKITIDFFSTEENLRRLLLNGDTVR